MIIIRIQLSTYLCRKDITTFLTNKITIFIWCWIDVLVITVLTNNYLAFGFTPAATAAASSTLSKHITRNRKSKTTNEPTNS